MAGSTVALGNKHSASRAEQTSTFQSVPVPARLAARTLPGVVKRAVSRDGLVVAKHRRQFAKIHSGLVVDASMRAASDRDDC
jgi:hypothetical protein